MLLCNRADEKAAEREERMRMRELEMEAKRIEKENRHEERMLSMMAAIIQQSTGGQQWFNPMQFMPNPLSSVDQIHNCLVVRIRMINNSIINNQIKQQQSLIHDQPSLIIIILIL